MRFNKFKIDYYLRCADNWKAIFDAIEVNRFHTVVDLCPGWSPKIEIALERAGFSGTVIILDKSASNVSDLIFYLKYFNPKFKIEHFCTDILNNSEQTRSDLIIANHIIDDLLFTRYFESKKISCFDYDESPDRLKEYWCKIATEKECVDYVAASLSAFVCTNLKRGGIFLFTQYPGHIEEHYDLPEIYEVSKLVVNKTIRMLEAEDFQRDVSLIDKAYNLLDRFYISKRDFFCLRRTN